MGKVLTKNLFQLSAESPISSETLDSVGITSGLRSKYVKKGLLLSLQKGVYMLPNSNIKWQNAVEFLQRQHPSIHIGGRSALALNGVVHNIPADAKIHLWGNGTVKTIPNWFGGIAPFVYTTKSPFDSEYAFAVGMSGDLGIRVSEPERALFEILDNVGILYTVEESKNLFDLIISPRKKVLENLISNCKRIKVLRLLAHWGRELNVSYSDFLTDTVRKFDSRKHLNVVLPDKSILSLPPL